jgi:nucleotide-binding universal stress UspA family protein
MIQVDNILLARDFSSVSDQALRYALYLARESGATLHLFYADVLHEDPFDSYSPEGPVEAQIRQRLMAGPDGEPIESDGFAVETAVERDVAAAPAILNYAADHDVDIIVAGTHGRRGVQRILLGSVAEEIVRRADCPVLTVREPDSAATEIDGTVSSILVPIDFSKHSREALRYAREIGGIYNANIHLLHVVEENLHPAFYVGGVGSIYDVQPDIDEKATTELHTFFEETEGPAVENVSTHVATGRAARKITTFAESGEVDLLVMSTHGLTGLEHFFLGSVAEKVVRRSPIPVFTVKSFGKSLLT